ncbi:putative monovalent cation/H+ antiporter subunit A [candidate division KSB1 bacterium]|nr:putative monovalent cation/H+ antiporter subunit A [candidate division KSB1 bacterium]
MVVTGAILSLFIITIFIPVISRIFKENAGKFLAILPLSIFAYLTSYIPKVCIASQVQTYHILNSWFPALGINFSLYLDGLSLIFSLLITGIGTLIVIYGSGYLHGHQYLTRFYIYLFLFMASMLGVVLAGNLITIFIFWELTSFTSYLLIGFKNESEESRWAALQALLVTGLGGLALLAGFVLIGTVSGTFEITELLNNGDVIRSSGFYLPILLLILGGAFTKSAQLPFHFWLVGAMQAPTPVSAYLHSATMVKAGVYLLARMHPLLGNTGEWHYIVTFVGVATMLIGALQALPQVDLKKLLAYTTISALGTLTMLLGFGTTMAIKAAMVYLIVHSLYKGALFMVAGAVDHETGTRDVQILGGLVKAMPMTAIAAGLAALSMSGFPPLLGFISKELLYEANLYIETAPLLITIAGIAANVANVTVAAMVGICPFICSKDQIPATTHKTPATLWTGPLVLAFSGLILGLFPDFIAFPLISSSVTAIQAEQHIVHLKLWHGVNVVFLLSVLTLILGIALYFARTFLRRNRERFRFLSPITPTALFKKGLDALLSFANLQTRLLQNGYLRYYLITIILSVTTLILIQILRLCGLDFSEFRFDVTFYELILVLLMVGATFLALSTRSRITAVIALGVVGYGVATIFILFGAPDLAITQFLIETLTVILFLLVVYHLPSFTKISSRMTRFRDFIVSASVGVVMTILVLSTHYLQLADSVSNYFNENCLKMAHGRNIVNVILVDFRAFDTMGEITVLSIAAIGVFAILKIRTKQKDN